MHVIWRTFLAIIAAILVLIVAIPLALLASVLYLMKIENPGAWVYRSVNYILK